MTCIKVVTKWRCKNDKKQGFKYTDVKKKKDQDIEINENLVINTT